MRKTVCCAIIVSLMSSLSLFGPDALAKTPRELRTVVFKSHLHCENCVKKVMENVSYAKGVKDLEVSLEKQEIKITFDAAKTDAGKLAAEIVRLGYPAEVLPDAESGGVSPDARAVGTDSDGK